ncbi:MAG: bacillithiol biosynthesis BshC [Candidatus Eisenbacteria bacterium]|uniref:Bacillithiol biosynthesis BshC n=1 Tax=Eiseniibacteriota bacterium TaxID=2212470 RepID=A0A956RQ47_UNCEI|nr:bacillithiol biosynthesis BshC [Candidatus Eisenbacteria bacterium]
MKSIGVIQGQSLRGTLGGDAPLADVLSTRARLRFGPGPFTGDLHDTLVKRDIARGAPAGAIERARAVSEGRGLVVLAGQQPALWGGPLYSLYKLIAAIDIAAWLEARAGVPVLPVFWIVGDDSDFGEVSSIWLPTSQGRIVKVRDEEVPPSGTCIGTLPASRQRTLLQAHAETWREHPRGAEIWATFSAALEEVDTWAAAQAAIFHRLLPEDPFLVVDGGDPALLDVAQDFLRGPNARTVAMLLEEGAVEARAAGIEPAFEADLATRMLFRIDGDQRKAVDGAPGASELLAPNVLLRPCLQDWVFPNLATICGPSEIRYRMQLGPLYRALAVSEPVRLPRLHALLVPPIAPEPDAALDGYGPLLEDPAAWIDRRVAESMPTSLIADLGNLRDHLRTEAARLGGQARGLDPSLDQLFESAAGKADYQLDRMLEGVRGKVRHRLLQSRPLWSGLVDFLRPRDREQERVLSLGTPFLSDAGTGEGLRREAARSRDALLSGDDPRAAQAVLLLDAWHLPEEDRS